MCKGLSVTEHLYKFNHNQKKYRAKIAPLHIPKK